MIHIIPCIIVHFEYCNIIEFQLFIHGGILTGFSIKIRKAAI